LASQALKRLTAIHGKHLTDAIEMINDAPTAAKAILMQRLFVVSLAAFWEAFHEELCRETLVRHPNPPGNADQCIENFHNPVPRKIDQLYRRVLGIQNITESWWGNRLQKTGKTPLEFSNTIQRMMDLRHDTAHGDWACQLSPADCQAFLSAVLHLAIRTDEAVRDSLHSGG
jgi:hypothetical protein